MGYPWHHLDPAVSRKHGADQGKTAEDIKCSLIGNAFCAPAIALLTGDLLWQRGCLKGRTTPEEAWGVPDKEEQEAATLITGRPWQVLTPDEKQLFTLKDLISRASYTGCDIRIVQPNITEPNGWPRQSVVAEKWLWRVKRSFPLAQQHINLLELKAVLAAIKYRLETPRSIGTRIIHVSDSQVAIAACVKGRSGSYSLCKGVRQYCALVLAGSLTTYLVWVHTDRNPADAPSRRWAKRGTAGKFWRPTSKQKGKRLALS